MRKRPWLIWVILIVVLIIVGLVLWLKHIIDEQPEVHADPGIPDVVVPLPEDVE